MKLFRLLALLGALTVVGSAGTAILGCAALTAALPTVTEIVSDAVAILGMIGNAAASYFRSSPNPSKQAQIEAAIQKAQAALVAGEQVMVGVQNATAGQTAAAFAAFSAAYGELMTLVAPLGIVPAQPTPQGPPSADGGAVRAEAPPFAVIPVPLAVRAASTRGGR